MTYLRLLDYRAKITGLYTVKPPQPAAVAPVAPRYDPPTPEELRWFTELTNQMCEQNGVIDVKAVEPSPTD